MTRRLQSYFAILDVKHGRKALEKHLYKEVVPVIIEGTITGAWGDDDGESQEFTVVVSRVTTRELAQ